MRIKKGDFAALMQANAVPMPISESAHTSAKAAATVLLPPYSVSGVVWEEKTAFAQNGVSAKRVWQLGREHPSTMLDLHGMTAQEAHAAVEDSLAMAWQGGDKLVQIIHGKGLHSPDGRGILRTSVRYWLENCRAVLAYCELPANAGVVNVLLRKRILR